MPATKTLILVGPGKHFGFHLAKRFANEGFHIVLGARDVDALQKLSERLSSEGASVNVCALDVRDAALGDSLRACVKQLPPVHAVICNVRASMPGNGLSVTPAQLTEALDTNVSGALATIQACLPLLAPRSSIMLTGGGYKDVPDPEKLALSVSKGALHTLFLAMAPVLEAKNIYLKTLIINGAVREEGPIKSRDVADAFWNLYKEEASVSREV